MKNYQVNSSHYINQALQLFSQKSTALHDLSCCSTKMEIFMLKCFVIFDKFKSCIKFDSFVLVYCDAKASEHSICSMTAQTTNNSTTFKKLATLKAVNSFEGFLKCISLKIQLCFDWLNNMQHSFASERYLSEKLVFELILYISFSWPLKINLDVFSEHHQKHKFHIMFCNKNDYFKLIVLYSVEI